MKTKLLSYLAILAVTGLLHSCSSRQANKKTIENIKTAVIRENKASATYNAYKVQAEKEYFLQIAKLFKALSVAENIHFDNFIRILKSYHRYVPIKKNYIKVDSTKYNLQNSIKQEIFEIDSIYPAFIKVAEMSSLKNSLNKFNYTWKAEKTHKDFLITIYDFLVTDISRNAKSLNATLPSQKHLAQLDAYLLPKEYYVCPVDGRIFDNMNVPYKCDICKTYKWKFIKIE